MPLSPLRLITLVALTATPAPLASSAPTRMDLTPRALDKLEEGLVIGDRAPAGYSHVAMLSWPKIRDEDLENTPGTAAKFSQMFGTAVVARVLRDDSADPPAHRLERLAVGHVVKDDAGARVVAPGSDGLTFMAGQVLANGDKELGKMTQVARYDTAVVFDSPAIVLRGGEHEEMVVRHFVWTNAQHGGLATALWLLDTSRPGSPRVADSYFVLLPENFREDRLLSVDSSRFTLGIPGRTAFALARLPSGRRVAVTPELARVAALPRYDVATLTELARRLALAVAAQQANP